MKNTEIITAQSEIKNDNSTGLSIIGSHLGETGFEHNLGLRKFGNLTIAETIAAGTGVTFLSGVRVYDQENKLLVDFPVANGVKYSREVVRRIVLKELLKMLKDASKQNSSVYDEQAARQLVDSKLKLAYYEQSYKSVLSWAEEIGIEIN
ncbi:MAG: hypothetical protein DRI86_08670 [Bacteroidetes bacterium]|nr:MAG: hypothetical protein DRI86_08670 [Bacteroidota bacterium]